jgi:hypothetical protein
MHPGGIEKGKIMYDDDMDEDSCSVRDERIYSNNPRKWDEIEDLNLAYKGYFLLPDFYLTLREEYRYSPFTEKMVLFDDGIFVEVLPGQTTADVYKNYKKNLNSNYKAYDKYSDAHYHRDLPRLELVDERDRGDKPWDICDLSIDNMKFEISKYILRSLQVKKGLVRENDLKSAYEDAVCGIRKIKKFAPYEDLLKDKIFTDLVSRWRYLFRIARLVKFPGWPEILRKETRGRIPSNRISISEKWYEKYKDYAAKTENLEKYSLEMNSYFQDVDSCESIDEKESFDIPKKDLFDPTSDFYILKLIAAFMNRDYLTQVFVVPEILTVKDGDDSHRIVFGEREKNGKLRMADNGGINADDSICSFRMAYGFLRVADWQKKLALQR